eukprot:m.343459 g.343459  ORF g.343459 m.343459 type:complete len:705 (-) comp22865_c0_seq1:73-2187(-)
MMLVTIALVAALAETPYIRTVNKTIQLVGDMLPRACHPTMLPCEGCAGDSQGECKNFESSQCVEATNFQCPDAYSACKESSTVCSDLVTKDFLDGAIGDTLDEVEEKIIEQEGKTEILNETILQLQEELENEKRKHENTREELQAANELLDKLRPLLNLQTEELVKMSCVGAKYINNNGTCVSCVPAGTHYYSNYLARCVHCSDDSERYINASGVCTPATKCSSSKYEKSPPKGNRDRKCFPLTPCSASTQYIKVAATTTSDRTCRNLTQCNSTQYISKQHTEYEDRECKSLSPPCADYEQTPATTTSDRVCVVTVSSCREKWKKDSTIRNSNGYYDLASFPLVDHNTVRSRWTGDNCRDSGRYVFNNGEVASQTPIYNSYKIVVERITWYSVYSGGARGCKWMLQGSDDGSAWNDIWEFDYRTSPERTDTNHHHVSGARYNSVQGCGGYSGHYVYSPPAHKGYRKWRIIRGAITVGHCPRSSSVAWTTRREDAKIQTRKAYCDMKRGGWELVYNRANLFFTPDHMKQDCSTTRIATVDKDSNSWCIPNLATKWMWEVAPEKTPSVNNMYRIATNIPTQAFSTSGGGNVGNLRLKHYTSPVGSVYYQRYTSTNGVWGCSSGRAGWFGLVRASQGQGDYWPAGIGGHCDSCSISGTGMTWGSSNIEYYLGNYHNAHGCSGAGGTACSLCNDNSRYKWLFRFWSTD